MTTYTTEWMQKGLCAGKAVVNTSVIDKAFFPHKGRPSNIPVYKDYCNYCAVSMECLKYALAHDLDGVWGNSTRSQREVLPPTLIQEIVQEAIVQGWYEPRIVVEIPIVPLIDMALDMMHFETPQDLTEEDFLFPFEWEDYQRTMLLTVESFEEPQVV